MATLLENALLRPAREVELLGGLYQNRRDFYLNTLLPHVNGDAPLSWACFNQEYVMRRIIDEAKGMLTDAADIKADHPAWFPDITIPELPLADVWGRVMAFTPVDMSAAGQTQWNLDKFAAASGADDFKTYDAPNFADNFTVNQRIFAIDIMLYYSRLVGKLDDANTIRKTTLDAGEEEAATEVQAWIEKSITGIELALDYLGNIEMNYENTVNGPLSRKDKRVIMRKYNWIKATAINKAVVRPIDRSKVPVPDRSLLVRRTRTENIATM